MYSVKQTFSYNSSTKKFESVFSLPPNFSSGAYNLYLDGDQFLVSRFPGSIIINNSGQTTVDSLNFALITGDVNKKENSANKINILDYNVILACSIYSNSKALCDSNPDYTVNSDLNDDGIVDQDDFTLFITEIANQSGESLP